MQTLDMLYTATSNIHGHQAMRLFLRDLLTPSERIMLGRRIWIARLLLAGEKYDTIAAKLKLGYATIYRVERWLGDQFPGYEEALRGVEREFDKRAINAEIRNDPFSYASLKRKYPLHFLLFPAPKAKKKYRPCSSD